MVKQIRNLLIAAAAIAAVAEEIKSGLSEYGVDCSFPIHSRDFRCGDLLGDKKTFYETFMQGCYDFYPHQADRCVATEEDRLKMGVRQPQSMVNYTSTGYNKIKAPKAMFDMLLDYWEANKENAKVERWFVGNTYTNHWAAPTYLISVEDSTLRGGGFQFKRKIFEAAKSTIEEWTGMEQKPTSLYGIRMYTEGAVLSPHVDRLPLVSSCIVNVAQDIDDPWPLEVIDRDGKAVNITMEPGEMVLYESGSLIHGRPFPLKGRYFANIFIHFEPTGRKLGDTSYNELEENEDGFYPPYLLPNSPELPVWKSENPMGWSGSGQVPSAPLHQINHVPFANQAAAHGDLEMITSIYSSTRRRDLFRKDEHGWQPIHEAARGGHTKVIQFLIKKGADKNARTMQGQSPLNLVLTYFDSHHEAAEYLVDIGAKNLGVIAEEL